MPGRPSRAAGKGPVRYVPGTGAGPELEKAGALGQTVQGGVGGDLRAEPSRVEDVVFEVPEPVESLVRVPKTVCAARPQSLRTTRGLPCVRNPSAWR